MAACSTTAGRQYHGTALLSPERNKRGHVRHPPLSYLLLTLVRVLLLWFDQCYWTCRHDCNYKYHRGPACSCHSRISCSFVLYRALAHLHDVPGEQHNHCLMRSLHTIRAPWTHDVECTSSLRDRAVRVCPRNGDIVTSSSYPIRC